jgi:hypothetical protein
MSAEQCIQCATIPSTSHTPQWLDSSYSVPSSKRSLSTLVTCATCQNSVTAAAKQRRMQHCPVTQVELQHLSAAHAALPACCFLLKPDQRSPILKALWCCNCCYLHAAEGVGCSASLLLVRRLELQAPRLTNVQCTRLTELKRHTVSPAAPFKARGAPQQQQQQQLAVGS